MCYATGGSNIKQRQWESSPDTFSQPQHVVYDWTWTSKWGEENCCRAHYSDITHHQIKMILYWWHVSEVHYWKLCICFVWGHMHYICDSFVTFLFTQHSTSQIPNKCAKPIYTHILYVCVVAPHTGALRLQENLSRNLWLFLLGWQRRSIDLLQTEISQ